MDKSHSFSHCDVALDLYMLNEERSPTKFMTSAEAIRVSDSETSSDEHVPCV
ncbi:unnamed protein product [Rhodiola kirilowii]